MSRVWRALATALAVGALAPSLRAEWQETTSARGAVQFFRELGSGGLDGGETGLGLSLDLEAYRSDHFGLRASLGYFQLEAWRTESPFGGPHRSDIDGLYLSLGPILRAPGLVSPYLTVGAGLYLTDYTSFLDLQVGGGARARVALAGGSLNLGLRGGGGLDLDLGDGFGLGAELSYSQVLSQGRNLELLGVHVGLDYRFE
jgi:opacity protein-like surface antigen